MVARGAFAEMLLKLLALRRIKLTIKKRLDVFALANIVVAIGVHRRHPESSTGHVKNVSCLRRIKVDGGSKDYVNALQRFSAFTLFC
jgi:hypothetical protein